MEINEQEIKDKIVDELFLEGLDEETQNKVIVQVTAALLDRAKIALLKTMSDERIAKILQKEVKTEKSEKDMVLAMMEEIPNAQKIVQNAMKEGLQAYKEKFLELVAKEQ